MTHSHGKGTRLLRTERIPCNCCFFMISLLQLVRGSGGATPPTWNHCNLADNPIVTLVIDEDQRAFVSNGTRSLRKRGDAGVPGVVFSERDYSLAWEVHAVGHTKRKTQVVEGTVDGRACDCYTSRYSDNVTYYCPLDRNYCYSPTGFVTNVGPPSCVNESSKRSVAQLILPFVEVMFCLVGIGLIFSVPGIHALSCFPSHTLPCWNKVAARYMIRRNPERAYGILRNYFLRGLDQPSSVANHRAEELRRRLVLYVPALRLSLKTAKFNSSIPKPNGSASMNGDDVVHDHTCSICFVDLNDGDRVPLIPCAHLFHVECLKTWLKRRNTCPLCLQPDIAQPYTESSGEGN
jgi:hypothetical protein